MARFRDGLVDGFAGGFVTERVVKHVEGKWRVEHHRLASSVKSPAPPLFSTQMRRLLLFKTSIPQHSDRHYLVVPVEHIPTVKDLQRRTKDFSLVSRMLNVGQNLLHRDAPQSKHRFGFHQHPLNSVNHVHLHCFALPYTPRWKHIKYMSLGCLGGFIEAKKLLERIKPFSSIPSKV